MENWKKLNSIEYDSVWDKFEEKYQFRPSVSEFPGITNKFPQLKFDIEKCYDDIFKNEKIENIALDLFKKITKPNERMYALDWQHESYDFDPRFIIDKDEIFDEWIIPIFRNGDYYIFVTKDFKKLWFGHPWEQTITLVGEEIIKYSDNLIADFEKLDIKLF